MDNNSINKLLEILNSTNFEDVKQNLRSFKYQNNEVPYVRKWINEKEQELRLSAQNPTKKKNEINFNHERPYKKLSNSKLHQIKNDIDIRSAHRSLAEAEIAYRQERRQKFTLIIAVISLVAALIYNFGPWVVNALTKIPWP